MGALFAEVRNRVTAEDAARAYGLLRSDWQRKAICPWHGDKNPSLSFDRRTGRCRCFVCHKGGSAIDLTAQLFKLSPLDAAKKLNADFRLNADETSHAPPPIGESRLEQRKRFNAFIRKENKAACTVLRSSRRMLSILDGIKEEDAFSVWVQIRDCALEWLDWIDHLSFDEWRQEDEGRKVRLRISDGRRAG